MVIQSISQIEVSSYSDSYDMIKFEEKDKVDQIFSIVQKLFNENYDLYAKHSRKNNGQFEGANVIQQVAQQQEQLYVDLQYYLEKLAITNFEEINDIITDNQATVTLNGTLLQTIAAQNKKYR